MNIDESACALDGNKGHKRGRPSVIFYYMNLPRLSKATAKSSLTTTFITGSTAAGEVIPPHFQFFTKANTDDGKKLDMMQPSSCQTSAVSLDAMNLIFGRAHLGLMKREGWMISNLKYIL